ncbi:tail fiber assembly protein [Pseudomonas sp. RAC1]|uniref:tail fiber assembly protein n=1 Tax=Pseudomonas sp. RAC1 TaxID=3064900 RepID=UPI00271EAF16|nr:tail fiber assembly protein [Pseudomonas sp. RAC1]MDV9031850.1 tail fiber assembly protein [Pseudomonas sp. RAC1]
MSDEVSGQQAPQAPQEHDELAAQSDSSGPAKTLPWWQLAGVEAPKVCNVHRDTGEYVGLGEADPSPLEPGVWVLPACSYRLEAPVFEAGFAALINRDGTGWERVADHRGATVYSTGTGESQQWQALGDLPQGYTLQAPTTAFDTWEGEQWVPDEAAMAEAARRSAYFKQSLASQYATSRINTLQDAVDLGMATDSETDALKAWKVYRVKLGRLDINVSVPADDEWPNSPNDQALVAWLASQTE